MSLNWEIQELASTRDKLAVAVAQSQKANESLRSAAVAGKKLADQLAQERAAREVRDYVNVEGCFLSHAYVCLRSSGDAEPQQMLRIGHVSGDA